MHQKLHKQHETDSIKISPRIRKIQKEIFKTLLYSDLFRYPLTGDQVFQYLGISVKGKDFLAALKTIPYMIVGQTIYYHLPKHQKNVDERIRKEKWNNNKIKNTRKIASILGFLPTIRFIGISGSLALKNAERVDDADLFFICAPYTVWITRLLIYAILQFMGVRRERNEKTSETICANMFMDQRFLSFSKTKRNLYIAHEIVQILPVVDKESFQNQLLLSNTWVKEYFPNLLFPKKKKRQHKYALWNLLRPIEFVFYHLQLWYMREHKTREVTTESLIAFHPIDYENLTMSLYNKKSLAYEI